MVTLHDFVRSAFALSKASIRGCALSIAENSCVEVVEGTNERLLVLWKLEVNANEDWTSNAAEKRDM